MDELHTESGIKTLAEFKAIWQSLTEEGWEFVSTLNTEDEGQVLIFRRHEIGLGQTGDPTT
jgi:DNA-binding PadR family transcriptional regulator